MKFKVIASGSKGNSTVILTDTTKIDMGISYLTLKKSLEEDSLSLDNFTGILITHCHKDHINGLASLIKHTKLKVYIPEKMYDSLKEVVEKESCIFIDDNFRGDEKSKKHKKPKKLKFKDYKKNTIKSLNEVEFFLNNLDKAFKCVHIFKIFR